MRVTNLVERTEYDGETGEITYKEEENTVHIPSEPNFIKMYLEDVLYLTDLPKGLNPILYAFLKRMSYGNELVINAALKRQIAKEVDRSVSSVNNAITSLVKGKILKRIDTGYYMINPRFFGKGEWKDIAKLRMTVEYTPEGKTFMAEVKREEENESRNVM